MGSAFLLVTAIALLIVSINIGTVSADEELVAIRGENVTISVILLQNGTYGDPIPEQQIEFFDETNNLLLDINITDSNGLASINWIIPIDYSLGPTTVNATFRGNASIFLAPSHQSIILNILASTEIIVQNTPVMLAPGDILSFSVTLFDDTSNPLNNRTLSVLSDDILLATSVTNITGGASFSIDCNSSWSVFGENVIQIIHEQDIENYYERAETLFSVEIQKLQTSIESNFSINSIPLNDVLNLEVELMSSEGGISSNLEILFDGQPLTVVNTDYSGNGTLYLDIDEQFTLGHHYLTITYNGSERYAQSILAIEIDILSPAIIKITPFSSTVIGFDSNIAISLHDILGRPIEGILTVSDLSNGRNTSIQIPDDTIDFTIDFPVFGPIGPHNLLIEIGNPYVTNMSFLYNTIVWSQPVIALQDSNILHFASPNQNLTFTVRLYDWSSNISYQSIQLLCNDETVAISTSNEYGLAIIFTMAPNHEGTYNLSIIYSMNTTRYEMHAKFDYHLTVSIFIPVLIELDYYEVISPIQKIAVFLRAQCLNGSIIEGIQIKIQWGSTDSYVLTQRDGTLVIYLPVPDTSGVYTLYYEIEQNHDLAASAGAINISISLIDILSSQGLGINGFAVGILTSFVIVAIPVIRRKYLMI